MLKPIGDHILVKPLPKEEVTKSGIVIPDTVKEKPQEGTVLAVGMGKYFDDELVTHEKMGIKVGQHILFSKYGPTEVKIDGEEYFILESNDVLGILEDKKK